MLVDIRQGPFNRPGSESGGTSIGVRRTVLCGFEQKDDQFIFLFLPQPGIWLGKYSLQQVSKSIVIFTAVDDGFNRGAVKIFWDRNPKNTRDVSQVIFGERNVTAPCAKLKLNAPAFFLSLLLILHGCTAIPVDERSAVRAEVSQAANETIEQLLALDPSLEAEIESSAGYFAARVGTTKLPLIGGGYGLGVAFDKLNATRTYLNVMRYDLGAGLGIGGYRVLVLFETRKALDDFVKNGWKSGVGAESRMGQRGRSSLVS